MDEGREDRTQIEAVITVPKTDHKVARIPVKEKNTRKMRTNMDFREAIPGIGVVNTGTVLTPSCGVMLLGATMGTHYSGRRSACNLLATDVTIL